MPLLLFNYKFFNCTVWTLRSISLFVFIAFINTAASAQQGDNDIAGVWTGKMYNDTSKQFIPYQLAISEKRGSLSGYSHTTFIIDSIENIGVKAVKIVLHDQQVSIEDEKLVDNNYREPAAKGVRTFFELILSRDGDVPILTGNWHTNRTKIYNSVTGTVWLEKAPQIETAKIIVRLKEIGLATNLSFISPNRFNRIIAATNVDPVQKNRDEIIENKKEDSVQNIGDAPVKSFPPTGKSNDVIAYAKTPGKEISSVEKIMKAKPDFSYKKNTEKAIVPVDIAQPEKIEHKKETSIDEKENGNIVKEKTTAERNDIEKNKFKSEIISPIKALVVNAGADINRREIETIRTVDILNDSLVLSLYDNGAIDGDTVSVFLNGEVIMPRVGLLAKAYNKTIYLTPEMGDSIKIIMYAENLGSIPPNTGLLVVRDGDNNYEIRFSGDLKKNSAIILKRKKQ